MVACILNVLAVSALPSLTRSDIWLRISSVLWLIALNAFFVAAEFSIVSLRRSRIQQLVEAGDIEAVTVATLQRSIDRLLSTTQLGITLSSLALGWIGESTMGVLIAAWLQQLPVPLLMRSFATHSLSIPIAFVLVAYLQIVLGELCPKSVALLYSEQLARFLAVPVSAIARFFTPCIWILNQSTRLLLRLVGIRHSPQSWLSPVTPEELQLIISTERESTGLEAEERELLNNIFEFGAVTVQEVMVERNSIVALPASATLQTLLEEMARSCHSRYPVIGRSLDEIRGIVHFKDLAEPLAIAKLTLETPLQPWLRPARFIPEYTPLSELLPLMQRSQLPMVIVVNEFGGTVGLVTLQDLIAQIIGNIGEIEKTDALLVQNLDEQTYLVQAQISLEELNEILNLNLPLSDRYQTLGGFVLHQLQKIPTIGETLQYQGLELTIVSTQGARLHHIKIRRHQVSPTSENEI